MKKDHVSWKDYLLFLEDLIRKLDGDQARLNFGVECNAILEPFYQRFCNLYCFDDRDLILEVRSFLSHHCINGLDDNKRSILTNKLNGIATIKQESEQDVVLIGAEYAISNAIMLLKYSVDKNIQLIKAVAINCANAAIEATFTEMCDQAITSGRFNGLNESTFEGQAQLREMRIESLSSKKLQHEIQRQLRLLLKQS